MGWEIRGSNTYYYRKKRVDNRVISEYVGTGEAAQMLALLDREEQERRKKIAENIRQERNSMGILSLQADEVENLIKQLIDGVFLVSGFHKHKGQWRKRRNGR